MEFLTDNPQPISIIAFAAALSILAIVVWQNVSTKRSAKRDREEMALYIEQEKILNPVVIDWRVTGRINMICIEPEIMFNADRELEHADFILLIEEKRLVADISGAPTLQTQWRKASRRDARTIVRRYHERAPAEGPGEKLAEQVTGSNYEIDPVDVPVVSSYEPQSFTGGASDGLATRTGGRG